MGTEAFRVPTTALDRWLQGLPEENAPYDAIEAQPRQLFRPVRSRRWRAFPPVAHRTGLPRRNLRPPLPRFRHPLPPPLPHYDHRVSPFHHPVQGTFYPPHQQPQYGYQGRSPRRVYPDNVRPGRAIAWTYRGPDYVVEYYHADHTRTARHEDSTEPDCPRLDRYWPYPDFQRVETQPLATGSPFYGGYARPLDITETRRRLEMVEYEQHNGHRRFHNEENENREEAHDNEEQFEEEEEDEPRDGRPCGFDNFRPPTPVPPFF